MVEVSWGFYFSEIFLDLREGSVLRGETFGEIERVSGIFWPRRGTPMGLSFLFANFTELVLSNFSCFTC